MSSLVTAHVETMCVVLRVFSEGRQFGDPYDWCATGVRIAPGTLEILGVLEAPLPSQWRALFAALKAQGWHTLVWWRHRPDGQHERRKIRLAREPPASNEAAEDVRLVNMPVSRLHFSGMRSTEVARSYDVKLTLEIQPIGAADEPPRRPWVTRQEYPDMDYQQVVNVEEAVIQALLGLGRAAVATKQAAG